LEAKTIVTVTRMLVGGAIFITSMVTDKNGAYQMLSMLLMGAPLELLQPKKEEEK
jgi:hypothetical protein